MQKIETENTSDISVNASIGDIIEEHSGSGDDFYPQIDSVIDTNNSEIQSENSGDEDKSSVRSDSASVTSVSVSFKDLFIQTNPSESANYKRKASESPKLEKIVKKITHAPEINMPSTSKAPLLPKPLPDTEQKRTERGNEVPLKNRYAPLQTHVDDADDETDADESDTIENRPVTMRRKRPPAPIVIPGAVTNHHELINKIKKCVSDRFNIKYTNNNVNIYLDKKQDKDKLLTFLKPEVQYHTYTDAEDKTHAFVLRGLDQKPLVEAIKDELNRIYDIQVKNIYKMNTKFRPLYLVVTTAGVTLKDLRNTVRHLMYTTVTWEKHERRRVLTQCHRCQYWGHATSNCNRVPRCVKCGQNHLSAVCTKKKIAQLHALTAGAHILQITASVRSTLKK